MAIGEKQAPLVQARRTSRSKSPAEWPLLGEKAAAQVGQFVERWHSNWNTATTEDEQAQWTRPLLAQCHSAKCLEAALGQQQAAAKQQQQQLQLKSRNKRESCQSCRFLHHSSSRDREVAAKATSETGERKYSSSTCIGEREVAARRQPQKRRPIFRLAAKSRPETRSDSQWPPSEWQPSGVSAGRRTRGGVSAEVAPSRRDKEQPEAKEQVDLGAVEELADAAETRPGGWPIWAHFESEQRRDNCATSQLVCHAAQASVAPSQQVAELGGCQRGAERQETSETEDPRDRQSGGQAADSERTTRVTAELDLELELELESRGQQLSWWMGGPLGTVCGPQTVCGPETVCGSHCTGLQCAVQPQSQRQSGEQAAQSQRSTRDLTLTPVATSAAPQQRERRPSRPEVEGERAEVERESAGDLGDLSSGASLGGGRMVDLNGAARRLRAGSSGSWRPPREQPQGKRASQLQVFRANSGGQPNLGECVLAAVAPKETALEPSLGEQDSARVPEQGEPVEREQGKGLPHQHWPLGATLSAASGQRTGAPPRSRAELRLAPVGADCRPAGSGRTARSPASLQRQTNARLASRRRKLQQQFQIDEPAGKTRRGPERLFPSANSPSNSASNSPSNSPFNTPSNSPSSSPASISASSPESFSASSPATVSGGPRVTASLSQAQAQNRTNSNQEPSAFECIEILQEDWGRPAGGQQQVGSQTGGNSWALSRLLAHFSLGKLAASSQRHELPAHEDREAPASQLAQARRGASGGRAQRLQTTSSSHTQGSSWARPEASRARMQQVGGGNSAPSESPNNSKRCSSSSCSQFASGENKRPVQRQSSPEGAASEQQSNSFRDCDDCRTICSSSSSISSAGLNKPFCKICHLSSTKNGDKLISPCKCSGTMRYIHCACLLKWLEISNRVHEKAPLACELCAHEYTWHKKFNFNHLRFPKCSLKDALLHLIFVAALCLMLLCALAPMLHKSFPSWWRPSASGNALEPTASGPQLDTNFRLTRRLPAGSDIETAEQTFSGEASNEGAHQFGSSSNHLGHPNSNNNNNNNKRRTASMATFSLAPYHSVSASSATGRLASEEKFILLCAALFFLSFFLAIYVQTKARDTLYGLIVKFANMNLTYYITEYQHEDNAPKGAAQMEPPRGSPNGCGERGATRQSNGGETTFALNNGPPTT